MARPFRHPKRGSTQGAALVATPEVPLEHTIERHLIEICQRHSFLCWKFTSPGRTGVPDRVIITPAGTVFVELKRPGATLRPKQQIVVAAMRRAGGRVYTIDSIAAADDLVAALWTASKDASIHRLRDLAGPGALAPGAATSSKPTVRERITS